MRSCLSVSQSIRQLVHLSVHWSVGIPFLITPKMSGFLYEIHWGSPTLTLLNVLGVLGVFNVLNVLVNVLNVLGLGVFGKVEIFNCSEFQNVVTYDCCKFFCLSFSS